MQSHETEYGFDVGDRLVVVAGAGGFIGGHLCAELARRGARVRAADVKPVPAWFQRVPRTQTISADLQDRDSCYRLLDGADVVFNLAADMGGMGFIENNKARCMLSVLINTHMLMAAKDLGVPRSFYASSACVYAADKQDRADIDALCEADAYPAMPEDGYGWEKLFSERMCRHFSDDFGIESRVARYHIGYGPLGTYDGGREKASAAICRKVIEAKLSGTHEIEIWGDGNQTRSFTYIDDCVDGTLRLTGSDVREPVNIGSGREFSINQVAALIGGPTVHTPARGNDERFKRASVELAKQILGWEPETCLEDGIARLMASG